MNKLHIVYAKTTKSTINKAIHQTNQTISNYLRKANLKSTSLFRTKHWKVKFNKPPYLELQISYRSNFGDDNF